MIPTNTNSRILIDAARKLGISVKILNSSQGKIRLTKGKKSHIVHKHGFNINPHQAIILTRNKLKTLALLRRHGLPVPRPSHRFPLVVKPVSGQKGQHVYLDIRTPTQFQSALKRLPFPGIIQQFIPGHDLRFFILNGQVIGITHRRPPQITGDGRSTIKQLIEAENLRRLQLTLTSGRRMLNRLRHWPRIRWYLHLQGLTLKAILPRNKTITLYPISNVSTGGSAHALTRSQVPPSLTKLAEQAVKLTGLTVAGVDMIVSKKGAYILEINSDPSLRLHAWPNTGRPQPVAQKLLQYIFSKHVSNRN